MRENPNYYAIIPASVRYDPRLEPNAKLLFGEITALSNVDGVCNAGNQYFAALYGVDVETIKRWFRKLRDAGHIRTENVYREGSKEVVGRSTYIETPILPAGGAGYKNIAGPGHEKAASPGYKKIAHNNRESFNNGEIGGQETDFATDEMKEVLQWLKKKKNLKHMPTQEWISLFDDLLLNEIRLADFKSLYEWCEELDWRSGAISPKLIRSQVEVYLARNDGKTAKRRKENAGTSSAKLLERYS